MLEAECALGNKHLETADRDRSMGLGGGEQWRWTVSIDQIDDIGIPTDVIGGHLQLVERLGLSGRPLQSDRCAVDQQVGRKRLCDSVGAEIPCQFPCSLMTAIPYRDTGGARVLQGPNSSARAASGAQHESAR